MQRLLPSKKALLEPEEPIRSELFGPERLEQHARSLAAADRVVSGRRGKRVAPRVEENGRVLLAAYRSIALSARNAVLLSSPILLPNGAYDDVIDMVLNLNPRDALR